MSDSRRKHEAMGKAKRRGPKNQMTDDTLRVAAKSHKQTRSNDRHKLRRKWR